MADDDRGGGGGGGGCTKPISSVPFFSPNFLALWKQMSDIKYHIDVWQVSGQLSCTDTLSNMNVIKIIWKVLFQDWKFRLWRN